jgi:hypothetical protein
LRPVVCMTGAAQLHVLFLRLHCWKEGLHLLKELEDCEGESGFWFRGVRLRGAECRRCGVGARTAVAGSVCALEPNESTGSSGV